MYFILQFCRRSIYKLNDIFFRITGDLKRFRRCIYCIALISCICRSHCFFCNGTSDLSSFCLGNSHFFSVSCFIFYGIVGKSSCLPFCIDRNIFCYRCIYIKFGVETFICIPAGKIKTGSFRIRYRDGIALLCHDLTIGFSIIVNQGDCLVRSDPLCIECQIVRRHCCKGVWLSITIRIVIPAGKYILGIDATFCFVCRSIIGFRIDVFTETDSRFRFQIPVLIIIGNCVSISFVVEIVMSIALVIFFRFIGIAVDFFGSKITIAGDCRLPVVWIISIFIIVCILQHIMKFYRTSIPP